MVNNSISTVEKNLLEGALIVILVLIFFFRKSEPVDCSFSYSISNANCCYIDEYFWCQWKFNEPWCFRFFNWYGAVIIVEACLFSLHGKDKSSDHTAGNG
jgi:cobalt-zinc-cadmium resistance protein CzcA